MKILHPTLCYYPSQAGGPANTIYWLNNSLEPSRFSSKVITTKFGIEQTIETREFSKSHSAHYLSSKGNRFVKKGIRELRTADIVQFSSIFFPPTLPLIINAMYKKKSIIVSPRGELHNAAIQQKSFKKKLWISLLKLFQRKINFHATNEFELQIIQHTFRKAKSTVVIPNFIEMPEKKDMEVELKILFVGRINPIKNIEVLIEAISIVYRVNPSIKLEVIGAANLPYEKEYASLLGRKVDELGLQNVITFKGHLVGDAKNVALSSSMLLILPSKSENFGNVVLEALAQGTPVIASKNTPWKLLEDFNAGFWVESNPIEISRQILKVIELKDTDYKQMRSNAFDLCKSKFDIKTNIHVWEDYYNKIATRCLKTKLY